MDDKFAGLGLTPRRPLYLEQIYRYRVELKFALEAAQDYITKTLIADTDTKNRSIRRSEEWFSFRLLTEAVKMVYAEMTNILIQNLPPSADQLYVMEKLYNCMDLCHIPEYTTQGHRLETKDEAGVITTHVPPCGSIHPSFEQLEKKLAEGQRWSLKSPD